MPELAEVVFNASRWKAAVGKAFCLERIDAGSRCCRDLDTEEAWSALGGAKRLVGGWTHGKRMVFGFEGGVFLEVHLGMTGALRREGLNTNLDRHDHLALAGQEDRLVFRDPRQFGRVALPRTEGALPAWWLAVPPQPQEEGFTRERFEGILARRGGGPIKALLLQQEFFPGVGNWMADEILWRSRVAPGRVGRSLGEEERGALFENCRWVCREAIRIIGADYSDPPEDWLFRHRWRDGGVCPRTGGVLKREQVGGRTTCWSPGWQR